MLPCIICKLNGHVMYVKLLEVPVEPAVPKILTKITHTLCDTCKRSSKSSMIFSCPEQLLKSSCRSVGRSVGPSVGPSVRPSVRLPLWKSDLKSIKWKWLSEWVTEWLSYWGTEWLSDWVIEWLSDWVTEWLSGWVTEWLSDLNFFVTKTFLWL